MFINQKCSHFSQSFMNCMYRDNSLSAGTRVKRQKDATPKHWQKQCLRSILRLESKERKRCMATHFRKQGIKIHKIDAERMDEQAMFNKYLKKYLAQIENNAALRIQCYYRMSSVFRRFQKEKFLKMRAIRMIQKNFREYRRFKILPKIWRMQKEQKAVML